MSFYSFPTMVIEAGPEFALPAVKLQKLFYASSYNPMPILAQPAFHELWSDVLACYSPTPAPSFEEVAQMRRERPEGDKKLFLLDHLQAVPVKHRLALGKKIESGVPTPLAVMELIMAAPADKRLSLLETFLARAEAVKPAPKKRGRPQRADIVNEFCDPLFFHHNERYRPHSQPNKDKRALLDLFEHYARRAADSERAAVVYNDFYIPDDEAARLANAGDFYNAYRHLLAARSRTSSGQIRISRLAKAVEQFKELFKSAHLSWRVNATACERPNL